MNYSILIPLVLSSLIGLTSYIRGMSQKLESGSDKRVGGVRTFFLLSLSGLIAGSFYVSGNPLYAIVLSIVSISFIVIFFIISFIRGEASSFSDELAAILSHFLSFMWVVGSLPQEVLIAGYVAVVFIIEQGEKLVKIRSKIDAREISEIIVFLAVALIILPFVPNSMYSMHELGLDPAVLGLSNDVIEKIINVDIINPYKLWFIVVFVSGIDVLGYLLKKTLSSASSNLISAMIGGFVSSTSTTIALANKSKAGDEENSLVAGAVIANVVSFVQIFILLSPVSVLLIKEILPFIFGLILVGVLITIYFIYQSKKATISTSKETSAPVVANDTKPINEQRVFNLSSAIKFALLLTGVKILASLALVLLGSVAFVITSGIASLAGVDAVVITLGELFNSGGLTSQFAIIVFVLINAINLGSKVIYSFVSGSKGFAIKFAMSMVIMLILSILTQIVL